MSAGDCFFRLGELEKAEGLFQQALVLGQDTSALIGKTGTARTGLNPNGTVQVAGEQWSAHIPEGEAPIPAGTRVVVVAVDGLRLVVRSAIS